MKIRERIYMNQYNIEHQWIDFGENNTLIKTPEYYESVYVNQFASLALELTRHNYKHPFSVALYYRKPHLKQNVLGKKLIACITRDHQHIYETFAGHKFSPMIQLILDRIRKKEEHYQKNLNRSFIEETRDIRFATPNEFNKIQEDYNDFAMELRIALLEAGMKERVKSFTRNAKERYKRFLAGCSAAFEKHSRCLAIRLDTSSRKKTLPYRDFAKTTPETFKEECLEIDRHRENFVKHLNRHFGKELAFYAWKIEYGVNRGFHIHWFILLNGNKHQDRINIPMKLGEHWRNIITMGNGVYRNVNTDHDQQTSGLRVMHHSDPDLQHHMEGIASYLTKVDYHIKIVLPDNMRSFGCTKFKNKSACKPGPKRQPIPTRG